MTIEIDKDANWLSSDPDYHWDDIASIVTDAFYDIDEIDVLEVTVGED